MRIRAAWAVVLVSAACAHPQPTPEAGPAPAAVEPARSSPTLGHPGQVGMASFYGRRHAGRKTASGERYDPSALTCAHRTEPFGTRLRITDLETGRQVVVTVNDRGPFVHGRVVDLSLAAARELGMIERGVTRVRVERAER